MDANTVARQLMADMETEPLFKEHILEGQWDDTYQFRLAVAAYGLGKEAHRTGNMETTGFAEVIPE